MKRMLGIRLACSFLASCSRPRENAAPVQTVSPPPQSGGAGVHESGGGSGRNAAKVALK